MKLRILGAAGEVTGSNYMIETAGYKVLVDCGTHQGADEERHEGESFPYDPTGIDAVLLTHAHFDHIGAAAELQRGGALIVMHRDDVPLVGSFKNLAFYAGKKVEHFTPDVTVSGGETLDVAGIAVKVMHTPGHTAGGVCYIAEDCIFSGDTLFELSYGRTDFPTGSFKELKNSIVNKLFALKGDYKVFPGHGAPTTLQFEREHNPVLTD